MLRKLQDLIYHLGVTLIEVGKPNDGVTQPLFSSGTEIDKSWAELYKEFENARELWRLNPMARRVVGLITGYVVGPGMTASSTYEPLQSFIETFWHHPRNRLEQRLEEWSDELARGGELFLTLHPNTASGICQVRAVPATRIRRIVWRTGDYEMELAYNEMTRLQDGEITTTLDTTEGTWWLAPDGWRWLYGPTEGTGPAKGEWTKAKKDYPDGNEAPWMLHYAVNRPVGAVRGEGDLSPLLKPLQQYNDWLEDRVRLNRAVRSFIWIIKAGERRVDALIKKYSEGDPPESGAVIVANDDEEWQAVTPNLQARDAEADGRAIRRMIAAGGPGTSLVDFGDSDDASLATAKAAAELRRRFLVRRQRYFSWMLSDLIAHAFNRYNETLGNPYNEVTTRDVTITQPDISVEDNASIAKAASDLGDAIRKLIDIVGDTPAARRYGMRLFVRYVEESPSEEELQEMLEQGERLTETEPDAADEDPPENEMAARDDCGCKDGRAALQDNTAADAAASRFAAALTGLLLDWGDKTADTIGQEQFDTWQELVAADNGKIHQVLAQVRAAVLQVDDTGMLDFFTAILEDLLNDYRNILEVPEDDRPLTDSAWLEERTTELDLKGGAVDGIERGLRQLDQLPKWPALIAAGYYLSLKNRTDAQKAWSGAEARNRAQLDYLASQDARTVRVRDCVNGCDKDDRVCRARADVVMPIGLAREQRLAHPNCTLRFEQVNRSEWGR